MPNPASHLASVSPDALADRLRLIVITDRVLARPRRVISVVRAALQAGTPAIQLRDKELPPRDLLPFARQIRNATSDYSALFFLNDRLDIALAASADGVHLGKDDIPVSAARRIAPPGFLIGASARTPSAARQAAADGANYIGCGPLFATTTKADAGHAIGAARLAAVAAAVSLPVVAIGGISPSRASLALRAGASGCAVVAALMASPDPRASATDLISAISDSAPTVTPQRRNAPSGIESRTGRLKE